MTDLERARAHLLRSQKDLARERLLVGLSGGMTCWRDEREDRFLAALSWVWEEQEKDPRTQAERLIALAARVRERVAAR